MYDFIIIGSGFGGSIFTLRLADEGYRMAVLDAGKRFSDEIFAKSTGISVGFCVRVLQGFGRGCTPFCFIVLLIKML
ncbi:MAG: NAD(P)-binding protein [Deltaproteobacteria bacterium]|nr:NAD(P)-binding protein [Deltaproteobacteria bacterium]